MMEQVIFILSGGSVDDSEGIVDRLEKEPSYMVICADSGARHAARIGVTPYAIIGDMDSIDEEQLSFFEERGSRIIRYAAAKDETDTELALNYALTLAPKKIILFGALGSRMDHSLANIFLLVTAVPPGVDLRIIDDRCEIFLVEKQAVVHGEPGNTVSLLPLSPVVSGITLEGFEYLLRDGEIAMGQSLGVSNRLTVSEGSIRVRSGRLLVIHNTSLR